MTVSPVDASVGSTGQHGEAAARRGSPVHRPSPESFAPDVLAMREEADHQAVGRRIHPGVFFIVLGAYGWLMAAVWLVFGANLETAYLVAVATLLVLMFFGIPTIMRLIERNALHRRASRSFEEFSEGPVDINTGTVPGREVLVQVGLIPVMLAIGATLFAIEFALVRAGIL